MTPKLRRALFDAIDAVEAAGGRYAIVGGLAVGAWALPRATRDVDLYTDLDRDGRVRLAVALEARGFTVPAMEEALEVRRLPIAIEGRRVPGRLRFGGPTR